jgi:hypothetical protein
VASPKTTKPAASCETNRLGKNEQLGDRLSFPNIQSHSELQADLDSRGEDDWTFFSARPNARTRIRATIFDGNAVGSLTSSTHFTSARTR